MIKHALSLYISLFLAVGPVAAQQKAAVAGKGGSTNVGVTAAGPGAGTALPGLPSATPGLTGTMPAGASLVIASIEAAAARPESIQVLASNPSPAAAYARALIAAPVTPAARTAAVKSLGEPVVVAIEGAVTTLTADAAVSAKASASLKESAARFAALENRAPEALEVSDAAVSPARLSAGPARVKLSAPKRAWSALKTATIAATMAIAMVVASPAVQAQDDHAAPNNNAAAVAANPGANQTQGDYIQIQNAGEVLAKWTPATHLFISGDVRMDDAALRRLAGFLKERHWTVVLVENASGSTYLDAEGRTHRGLESYQYAFGQGLPLKGEFAALKNTAAGLPDGSLLFISFSPRYIGVVNSDAQRANGLDALVNNGDHFTRKAKPLMQDGKFYSAITTLIEQADQELDANIASAAQSAKSAVANAATAVEQLALSRAAFERSHPGAAATVGAVDMAALRGQLASAEKALAAKNVSEAAHIASGAAATARNATSAMQNYGATYASGQTALASARTEVDALEKASASFLKNHPKATGDIARPDVRAMREKLKSAESALSANPTGAKSAADAVSSQVRGVQSALAAHAAGADQIAASEEMLRQLEDRELAGDASTELVTAKQALREARESHDLGASSWASQLQTAKSALASAELTISDAEATAARNAFFWFWLKIITGLLTAGAAFVLNFRARKAGRKADAELVKWDAILETKLDAVIDQLDRRMDVYVGPISGEKSRGWEDETATAAAKVRQDAGRAKLYLAMARNIHDRATALVRPKRFTPGWAVNLVWPSRYRKAESLLAKEPLTFDPKEGFGALYEKKGDWRSDIYGEAKDYAAVSENFEGVMSQFNAASKSAIAALDEIERASTDYGAVFDATEASIAAAEKRSSEAASGAYFKVSDLVSKILPQARETLAAARGKAAKNPVGAMKGQGALAQRIAADAKSLSELALAMYRLERAKTDPIVAALAAAAVATKWIADSRAALDEQATKLAGSIHKTPAAQGLETLKAAYDTHAANLLKARNGLEAIAASRAEAVKSAAAVDAARTQVAAALDLQAENMLREAKNDPTQRLTAAAEALDKASQLLGAGKLAEAEASQHQGKSFVAQANEIVASSLRALKEQAGDVAKRISEAERLDVLLPSRAEVLRTIKRDFAASTLRLAAGDVTHPSANGTVEDNIDEAQVAIDAAKAKRAKSVRSFREAKVLEAASWLDQAEAHEQLAQARLDEVSEKRARLDKAVADNAATLDKLEAKTRAWKTEIPDDRRTMKPTINAFNVAVVNLADARAAASLKKGDPFTTASAIASVSAGLDQLWVKLNNDRDAYNEVVRSLQAASTQIDTAKRLAREAQSDGVADSPAISAAFRDLANLDSAYTRALASSQVEHGEWPTVDREADRITSEAAHVAASLSGEIAAAARATQAISNAASEVREATNWTGSYGVSVPGSPGSGSLDSARGALNNGDYAGAIRYAENARNTAISAVQQAEAEVSRRRRAEEEERRRQEEARRRREQEEADRRRRADDEADAHRRRSSGGGGGGGGFGGGGSSWGGGGGGGGSKSGMGGSSW